MLSEPTQFERAAMDHAGDMGGEYLESIRKSDLATMTLDEWHTFISCVCGGYVDSLLNARAEVIESAAKVTRCPF